MTLESLITRELNSRNYTVNANGTINWARSEDVKATLIQCYHYVKKALALYNQYGLDMGVFSSHEEINPSPFLEVYYRLVHGKRIRYVRPYGWDRDRDDYYLANFSEMDCDAVLLIDDYKEKIRIIPKEELIKRNDIEIVGSSSIFNKYVD